MESMNEQYGFKNESVKSLTGEPIAYCQEGQELKCNNDIEYLLQNGSIFPGESLQLVGETKKHKFILYKTFQEDSGFILQYEKCRHHRLTFFRPGKTFNILYSDHLFQAWESGPIKAFTIIATSIYMLISSVPTIFYLPYGVFLREMFV